MWSTVCAPTTGRGLFGLQSPPPVVSRHLPGLFPPSGQGVLQLIVLGPRSPMVSWGLLCILPATSQSSSDSNSGPMVSKGLPDAHVLLAAGQGLFGLKICGPWSLMVSRVCPGLPSRFVPIRSPRTEVCRGLPGVLPGWRSRVVRTQNTWPAVSCGVPGVVPPTGQELFGLKIRGPWAPAVSHGLHGVLSAEGQGLLGLKIRGPWFPMVPRVRSRLPVRACGDPQSVTRGLG